VNFKDEYINSQMFSWRHHPLRYVAREDELAYGRLYGYVEQLADSVSGLVSTPSFNQFLLESCQLLANSLDLIHQGYFDAAIYSVRQAGEVILIGTLFSNLEESERKAKYEKWVSLDRFPSFSELSKMLRSKDIEYRDLLEQMPEIDELINKLNKRANKYIHKQGHESFYAKPYEVVPESAKHIREDFTDYFKTTVKVCAIFRLAVDPFPILLSDPECEYRFPDCMTLEFGQSFIDNCLGNDFVERYIKTDYYRNWVNAIKSTFPQLKESTYNVSNLHYIDLLNIKDILDELDKLTLYEATAVLFTALFSEKVIAIHITGTLDAFSNSARPSSGLYLSDMSAFAEQLGGVNVPLAEICRLASLDTSHEFSLVSSFITSFSIASDCICVESDRLLDSKEVELGRKTAEELGRLWRQIKVGQCAMSELKETVLFNLIKQRL
jgi:hypothetical protein